MNKFQILFAGLVLVLMAGLFYLFSLSSFVLHIPKSENFRLLFGLPLALFFATCITFILKSGSAGETEISGGKYTFRGLGAGLIAWFIIFAAIIAAVKIL